MRLTHFTKFFVRCAALSLVGLSCLFGSLSSQEQHDHVAPLKLGEVTFPVSCKPAVQADFNQGVALLHSFAYSAAEKKFREIAAADPECAMAHWGVAMSFYHQLWEPAITPDDLGRGRAEIETAKRIGGKSERDQAFIEALRFFYVDTNDMDLRGRAEAYAGAMTTLAKVFPVDAEAQIFYALALVSTPLPGDCCHVKQKLAAAILEPLFAKYPEHPGIAHYLIHAYDNPEMASRGLPAARTYSLIAPSAPHALHMPSHIFTLLGLWQDSIQSNLAARAAAHAAGDIGEELHSMDYLMYAYLQAGRYKEAAQLLQELHAMPGLSVDQFKIGYAVTAMRVRFVVERQAWAQAQALEVLPGSLPQVRAIVEWAHAEALARGDGNKGNETEPIIQRLKELFKEVRSRGDEYWAAQVEIQILEAEAWRAYAKEKADEAVRLMRGAADKEDSLEKRPITPGPIIPAREQLGELLRYLKRPAEALKEFETSLEHAPRRRNGMMGAYLTAKITGDLTKAEKYRAELMKDQPGGD